MVEGRFVKNGEITEIYLPNGLTQLIVGDIPKKEIEAFTFMPKKQKQKVSFWKKAKDILILMSLFIPIIPVLAVFWGFDFQILLIAFCAGWMWDGVVIYANWRKKKV